MPEWLDSTLITAVLSSVTALLVLLIGRKERKSERQKIEFDQNAFLEKSARPTQGDMLFFINLYFDMRNLLDEYESLIQGILNKHTFINGVFLDCFKEIRKKSDDLHPRIEEWFGKNE